MTLLADRRRSAMREGLPLRVGLAWGVTCAVLLSIHMLRGGDAALAAAAGGSAAALAAVLGPLLALGLGMLLAARIAWYLLGEEAAGLACLAMALSVPVLIAFAPQTAADHAWRTLCLLVAVNAMLARSPVKGGIVAGMALAVWLAISATGAVAAAAMAAIFLLRWLRSSEDRWWLVHMLQALALGSVAVFVLASLLGDLRTACDAVSPLHIAALFGVAAGTRLIAGLRGLPSGLVLTGLSLLTIAAVGGVSAAAPQCAPAGARFAAPAWEAGPQAILQAFVLPGIALVTLLRLAGRSTIWLKRWWSDYALLLLAMLALALFDIRQAALAGALAAIPLGWQLREWLRCIRNSRRAGKRIGVAAGAMLALIPSMPLPMPGLWMA